MENEEPDKKNTWYNVGMIWELIMKDRKAQNADSDQNNGKQDFYSHRT